MKLTVAAGSTSKLIQVFIQDSSVTTGAGLTGLAYNTSSLTAYYYREGAANATSITLATMTLGTWASGGFVVVDGTNMPGVYQLGVPDAALAAGAKSVVIYLKGATNMVQTVVEIQLENVVTANNDKTGYTASTVSDKTGYSISGTLTTLDGLNTQLSTTHGSGTWVSDSVDIAAAVLDANTADHATAGTIGKAIGDAGSNVLAAGDIWDVATSSHTTAGTFAKLLTDQLDAAISSRATAATVWTNGTRSITGGTIDTNGDKTGYALSNTGIDALFTRQLTEAYNTDGTAPTVAQALFLILQMLTEKSISSTTLTVKKLDGSTTAATFTLNDGTNPTSITRAS